MKGCSRIFVIALGFLLCLSLVSCQNHEEGEGSIPPNATSSDGGGEMGSEISSGTALTVSLPEELIQAAPSFQTDYFEGWLPEERKFYDSTMEEWERYRKLVKRIQAATERSELEAIRDEVYDRRDQDGKSSNEYNKWLDQFRNDNYDLPPARQEVFRCFVGDFKPPYNELLKYLPLDGDREFPGMWDVYYGEYIMHEATVPELKKKARKAMDEMDKLKKDYEKGRITGEEGVAEVLRIWNTWKQ